MISEKVATATPWWQVEAGGTIHSSSCASCNGTNASDCQHLPITCRDLQNCTFGTLHVRSKWRSDNGWMCDTPFYFHDLLRDCCLKLLWIIVNQFPAFFCHGGLSNPCECRWIRTLTYIEQDESHHSTLTQLQGLSCTASIQPSAMAASNWKLVGTFAWLL